jgi:glutathione S-transferase
VPSIGLVEKGYADEDVELKVVNLLSGENYSPSYLRLNPNGTVPTLILPISDTTSPEVATKFRALTDSKEILEFLGQFSLYPVEMRCLC